MKRKLTALLLAILTLFTLAFAQDAAEPTYYYPAEQLNAHLFISPSWESLAVESYNIYPYETYVYDESGAVIAGSCLFYYAADPMLADPTLDPALAGIVMYPADETPEFAALEGFSYRTVHTGDTFCLAAAWKTEPAQSVPADAAESVIASFRDTDTYIVVYTSPTTLGDFHTTDLYGEPVTTHDLFNGETPLTLVNVWATYCQPCLVEMPYLGALAEEYADKGVRIIGIPIDIFDSAGGIDADQVELARRYAESTGANYTHLIPDSAMQENLLREVYYVPNSWFFDSEGNLIGEAIVGSYSKEDWAAQIEHHLGLAQSLQD